MHTRSLLVVIVVLLALRAAAGTRHAESIALAGIGVYQRTLAPIAGRMGLKCRFTPSCSRYAQLVIARDGLVLGGWETIARIGRCGPWTPPGTRDDP